ncbi:MAG: NusG domain II-containing protein [Firmicutes bacterium]|nr:NusG domain II-containing protein [Bacillota bacterium]
MAKYIRKADIILIIILIIAGIAATVILSGAETSGDHVVVTVNGSRYGSYPLSEDKTIKLDTGNTVRIEGGKVYMKSSTCSGKDCIKRGKISHAPDSIICLPHKVVVEIKGKNNDYDTIAE